MSSSFRIEEAGHALPAQTTAAEVLKRGSRVMSLDVTRGLAVAGMILVVSAGSWDHRYAPLLHADWYGWTLADMIFPLFLFTAGVALLFSCSVHLSRGISRRDLAWKVLRRAATIFIMGLLLNALPSFDLKSAAVVGSGTKRHIQPAAVTTRDEFGVSVEINSDMLICGADFSG